MTKSSAGIVVSVHAILRYAERVLGVDVATVQEMFGGPDYPSSSARTLRHLKDTGQIHVGEINKAILTPTVMLAASMGNCSVITPYGRLIIENGAVVSLIDREMRRTHRKSWSPAYDEGDMRHAQRRRGRAA